ncbi:MAG: beta-ketoacyl-[acyl-carrier-protein] synthase family protein [Flavobacteriales bacterium CG_4_10_14_0_2_um_filter_32_8]|nr:MAG: beta-ketoacyl-[acyl-carrier-protein] synthase family protein [Flavobacteriales bacterium CG_4_10_14_0_2_um_filter_32_8]PJB15218.1 MAG: beta-ketoacyl-[acyl-carrier-protein] synthase family protein [Flavobacteriales bacterium CG_4_9_14_3_um_filter_32_8]
MNIYITGIGVISAIGLNVQENYQSLKNKKTGIAPIHLLNYKEKLLVGEVKLSNEMLVNHLHVATPISRTSLLGIVAAKEAWGNNQHHQDIRTGLISSTSVGGMDNSEKYYQQKLENPTPDISLITTHDSGDTTERIAKELGISGYINTLSTACSSSANAIMLGARMLQQNKLDRVLIGGSDSLTNFTIEGFKSLMIYSDEWVKPFDEHRKGLNLGEGSGFLLLENEKSISLTKNKPLAILCGWSNAADAYHQTASSPDGKGATLAIQQALKKANLKPSDISYINAHGTGTSNNDLSESVALKNVFKENIPPFSSTKAYTGHTLAASGTIEAVYAVLALQHQIILPNLNYSTPISETMLIPEVEWKINQEINTVLSNSFGFGGNNSTIILKKA